jgi:hypothetical protein
LDEWNRPKDRFPCASWCTEDGRPYVSVGPWNYDVDPVDGHSRCDAPHDADDAAVVDYYHRVALPTMLQAYGALSLHAAAVGDERGAILVGGDSLVGKSTLAYGLDKRGWRLWADDTSVLEPTPQWRLIALPFRSRPRPAPWGRMEAPPRHQARPLDSVRVLGAAILRRAQGDGPSRGVQSRRLDGAEAFRALFAGAYEQEDRRWLVERFLRLASDVPVVELCYVPTSSDFEGYLHEVERELGSLLARGGP